MADRMLKNRRYIIHYPEIQLRKGRVLKKAGKTQLAVNIFNQLTKATVGSSAAIQGDAWFELALIYQHVFGDFDKAKQCYEKAASLCANAQTKKKAQNCQTALGELASYRISLNNEIAQLDSADTTKKSDSTLKADSKKKASIDTTLSPSAMRYRMGEIYWLRLDEPDSALDHFDAIVADTAARIH